MNALSVFVVKIGLESHNFFRLKAFGTLGDTKLHPLALVKTLIAIGNDSVEMDENVLARVALDKAIAFRAVEPLNCTLFFFGHDLELLSKNLLRFHLGSKSKATTFTLELL